MRRLAPVLPDRLISGREAARVLGLSAPMPGRLAAAGVLRAVRVSNRLTLFDREEVERLARERAERRGGTMTAKRAAIYCRVSTEGQERDGTSLQSQEGAVSATRRSAATWWTSATSTMKEPTRARTSGSGPGCRRCVRWPGGGRCRSSSPMQWTACPASRRLYILEDEFTRSDVEMAFVTEQFDKTPTGGSFAASAAAWGRSSARRSGALDAGQADPSAQREGQQLRLRPLWLSARDRETGTRSVYEPEEAVVRRIFRPTRRGGPSTPSSTRLNEAGVPPHPRARWTGKSTCRTPGAAPRCGSSSPARPTRAARAVDHPPDQAPQRGRLGVLGH